MTEAYSSLPMVLSAVIYLLAMTAHAIEWASARKPATDREQVLVGAGGPEVAAPAENELLVERSHYPHLRYGVSFNHLQNHLPTFFASWFCRQDVLLMRLQSFPPRSDSRFLQSVKRKLHLGQSNVSELAILL